MAAEAKPCRILMVHFDGAGNLLPQRALTRELVRRGHEVHILTHNSVAGAVSSDGAIFHPLATAHQYKSSDRLAAHEEIPFFLAEVIGSPAYSADFLGVADRVRPDIFLIDWLLVSVLGAAIDLPTPCVALNHMLYGRQT